jgi:hypothetical protein
MNWKCYNCGEHFDKHSAIGLKCRNNETVFTKDVLRLTSINQDVFWEFARYSKGNIFTYSQYFTYQDVKQSAKLHNITIKYCEPRSDEYKQYGCFTCRICDRRRYLRPINESNR